MGSKYANLFEQVGNAEDMSGWEPSLPAGNHRLALVKYGMKESQTDQGTVGLEAEFILLETDNEKARVGTRHSWYWNINGPKFTGRYARDRAKKFLEALQECVGNQDPPGPFGAALSEDLGRQDQAPEMLGLVIDAEITPKFKTDGTPVTFTKGGQVHDALWTPVPEQGEETFAKVRKRLEELAKRPRATASKQVGNPPAEAPPSSSISQVRSLLGKRSGA